MTYFSKLSTFPILNRSACSSLGPDWRGSPVCPSGGAAGCESLVFHTQSGWPSHPLFFTDNFQTPSPEETTRPTSGKHPQTDNMRLGVLSRCLFRLAERPDTPRTPSPSCQAIRQLSDSLTNVPPLGPKCYATPWRIGIPQKLKASLRQQTQHKALCWIRTGNERMSTLAYNLQP